VDLVEWAKRNGYIFLKTSEGCSLPQGRWLPPVRPLRVTVWIS